MGEYKKPIEQLEQENKIFLLYIKCLDKSEPDQQKNVARLWDLILRWNKRWRKNIFTGHSASDMSAEIFEVIDKFIGKNKEDVPKDKVEAFIKYLKKSLDNEEIGYYRKESVVNFPKRKMAALKEIKSAIKMKEKECGRKLTRIEITDFISEFFGIEEYNEILNLQHISSMESPFINKDGKKKIHSFLNEKGASDVFNEKKIKEPQKDYAKKHNTPWMIRLRDTVQIILKENQKDSDCYKGLFTLYCCIDKTIDLECLQPVLDSEILDKFQKDGSKPNQYEIYMKYYNVKKDSAEVLASKMWKNFRRKLKEKNPKIKLLED